ncbi:MULTISPECIES: ATP-binding protein [Niastella]
MGLGLYISAAIVERHCGTISVQSKERAGSIFTFTLPGI